MQRTKEQTRNALYDNVWVMFLDWQNSDCVSGLVPFGVAGSARIEVSQQWVEKELNLLVPTGLVVLEVRRTHFDATDIICCSFDFVQFDVPLTSYAHCIVSYFINLLLIVL